MDPKHSSFMKCENLFPPPPPPVPSTTHSTSTVTPGAVSTPISSDFLHDSSKYKRRLQIDDIEDLDNFVCKKVSEVNQEKEEEISQLKQVIVERNAEIRELKNILKSVQFKLDHLREDLSDALSCCS